ncbi:Transcriptional regulator GlxA family, contains an amidase domain and an AraC-type DNA-binding HTH domain [Variovorax sp. YR752]|uniref:GlxA family transcriptional regulator n=1 Tax=unclassified Variovorax TaxID=663243 RepID=UPI000BCD3073|nr:helix-turn-helix domain-containing protein [Variovorax sp. YR752]SOE06357.1 Transcriptional regulator GlxA family, contains an amidase domain and an AraC-type DNA-binding HTH domain [Variovorax sp. YR752]
MHKVWLLLFPGFPLVDVSGMLAVFEAANALRRNGSDSADYGVRLISAAGDPVLSSSGVALSAGALPHQLAGRANTLVIAGEPEAASAAQAPLSMQRLREWLSNSRRHLSRCAMLGAKALLLVPDLRRVRRRKRPAPPAPPYARMERSAPFAARVAMRGWRIIEPGQGVDLALSWVEEDRGTGFADTIASRLPEPRSRRYGMKRYRSVLIEQPAHDARITELHLWIATHLREKLSVARLAQEVHMSARSFARFYKRETGLTPGRGVQQIRLDTACRLIETSTRPLKAIAAQCGYRSREVMRRVFLRSLQMTPCEYRRRHAMASGSRPT